MLSKHIIIILQAKKFINCQKRNSSINVKSAKIKKRQRTKISIPLGMLRSVEKAKFLSLHSVRNATNALKIRMHSYGMRALCALVDLITTRLIVAEQVFSDLMQARLIVSEQVRHNLLGELVDRLNSLQYNKRVVYLLHCLFYRA